MRDNILYRFRHWWLYTTDSMRIQGGPPFTRPYKDRHRRLAESTPIPNTVISRPRASFHEVPKRPRQSSSFGSQATFLPSGQTNPQWMKTLEEKYRKLHMKIDSYGGKTNKVPSQQSAASVPPAGSNQHQNYQRTLCAFNRRVDLVRLGQSVLRFAKKTGKSEYLYTSTRTLLGEQQRENNKLISIKRHSQSDINFSTHVPDSTETSRQMDQHNSHLECEETPGTSHGSFQLVMKTPRVLETINCNKQGYPCDEASSGVNKHSINNIADNSDSYSVTNSGLDQQDSADTETPGIQAEHSGAHNQVYPLNDKLETYEDFSFRPLTASPSCNSHSSTHRSVRSRRPKTSLPGSEKSSYKFYRDFTRGMARNRLKAADRRKLSVIQGMSEEAKFAITETKKEMDLNSKTNERNGSAPHSGNKRESKSNGVRPKSEKVLVQHRLNGVDFNGDKLTNRVNSNEMPSNPSDKTAIPSSCADTTFDEASDRIDIELSEVCTKLPDIVQNTSKSSAYSKQRSQFSSSSGNYTAARRIAREKTFQITAPDYDVRFREVLSCDIPESETPPPDIKAQAVAKCSEWLNRRCAQNSRVIDAAS